MKTIFISLAFLLLACFHFAEAQQKTHSITFKIGVDEKIQSEFKPDGRLYVLLGKEKAHLLYPSMSMQGRCIFAKNITGWNANDTLIINNYEGWNSYQPNNFRLTDHPEKGWDIIPKWGFEDVPEGTYYVQFIWDQDNISHEIYSPGNVHTWRKKIEVNQNLEVHSKFSKTFKIPNFDDYDLIKEVNLQSDTLSKWWGKPVFLKAAVLLPSAYYQNQKKEYPIRYDVAGGNGRYHRIFQYWKWGRIDKEWWLSEKAPQMINVYLDGYGPYGDCYQMDSENNGPYGYALIHELIPYIEKKYRNTQSPETRFVSGCSTGGWVSLALQLFYPEHFNGAISYAPDPLTFADFLTVDIYKDKNLYVSNYGYPISASRTIYGHSRLSWYDLIQYERIVSHEDSYLISGEGMGMMNAVYSPKGKDGLPMSIFNQETGKINHDIAELWRKWDLLEYVKNNWETLGPKLQGKIYIQVSDNDNYYLNYGVRALDEFLKTTKNPKSDAVIEYLGMKKHCEGASQKDQIERTQKRLENCIKQVEYQEFGYTGKDQTSF